MKRESGRGAGEEGVGRREGEAAERGPSRESHDYVVFWESGILMNSLISKGGVCGCAEGGVSASYKLPYGGGVVYRSIFIN